jgi:hypothetical protein
MFTPAEINLGGVYVPPLLIAASLGFVLSVVTAQTLNRYRLARRFASPPLVFVALCALYTVAVGQLLIPF